MLPEATKDPASPGSRTPLREWLRTHLRRLPTWTPLAGHVALAAWFLVNLWHQSPPWGDLGDGLLYHDAAAAWIHGVDPWTTATPSGFHYAGLPTSVIIFAPFAAMDGRIFAACLGLASLAAAVVIVRKVRLPLYWLFFPPLVEAVNAGNPHVIALALMLTSGRPVASIIKVYFVVPLLGERRWRALAVLGAMCAITVVLWPALWSTYIREFWSVADRLQREAGGGFSVSGVAIIPVAIALASLGRSRAGWLAVPAIWPASQFFYASLALPVIEPWMGIPLAVRTPGVAAATVVLLAVVTAGRRRWFRGDPVIGSFAQREGHAGGPPLRPVE